MQSVMNVVMNRVNRDHSTPYEECVKRWQFSSITAKNDPQLGNWPVATDPAWQEAQLLAAQACGNGGLTDITGGATSYYAASMANPPTWASALRFTIEIEGQRFYA